MYTQALPDSETTPCAKTLAPSPLPTVDRCIVRHFSLEWSFNQSYFFRKLYINWCITLIYNFFAPAPKIKSYTSSRYITFEKLYIKLKKLYIKLAPQAKIWWKLSAAGEILKKIRVIYQFSKSYISNMLWNLRIFEKLYINSIYNF